MKLNHINLTTTDPVATAEFLVNYFGLRNEGGNKGFMLVRDDDDMVITLMKAKRSSTPRPSTSASTPKPKRKWTNSIGG